MSEQLIRPYSKDDHAWLVQQHQSLYAQDEGFDDSFGPLVSDILTDFEKNHDPNGERGWIAEDAEARKGSIFCVDRGDGRAKLRLFLVLPAARGSGLAQHLLETCLGFARDAGYRGLVLWTHESHKAAGRIYARNGFVLVDSFPTRNFGVDLVEQSWEISF